MPNASLLDILTRHQIYLEGVKLQQAQQFSAILLELANVLRKQFALVQYDSLDQLTKEKLNELLVSLRKAQYKIYDKYAADLYRFLREFMEEDKTLTTDVLSEASGKVIPLVDSVKLWSVILAAPLPANGILVKPFIVQFTNLAVNNVLNLVRQGYANKWTLQETLNNIIGTKNANYRDGALNRINNQALAVMATTLQHISIMAQAAVAQQVYTYYQWVSVIDDRTTHICLSRNEKIYSYGDGPLPPAHIRCRSKIIPVLVSDSVEETPKSYYAWLKRQPAEVQDDILGEVRGAKLRNGKLNAKDLPKFDEAKPLTLTQFKAKRKLILTS